ncbi:hypothetical protein COY89_00175 [Candidatus Roizmanbacteria bacterium CG_4_10_14_0_8_um_filter_36_36]|uniref:Uncharacterized protein n=1 Tax=Candidatus Roizmanbacteria bacterium CG10_big_fil_rev_8_21_14_0_10_36_26 TaxID=1974851 RepID=A0A2M8KMR3_9BACT|nr:MAG: hypothetical protein COY89_00175 [Candidatus Roizmanbacteria bacterium CG_4_10_14_0_8_um_filter_36_36]PJA52448.1 MAG: hypothetical protein CO166_05790 [Candidatus Roizmanbacteria bacterium CG_4_9_14_3_um_filter_36_11]PJE61198.1 MAG: hypothetical protein COU86_00280 [Candidatus Roizmanbacteria bacterium CG10_big_fil_rev_8_21_14_0_10_36_26]
MEPASIREISNNSTGQCPRLGDTPDNLFSNVHLPEKGQGQQRRSSITYKQDFSGDRRPVIKPQPEPLPHVEPTPPPTPVQPPEPLPPQPVEPPPQPPIEPPPSPPRRELPLGGRLITEPQLERRFVDHKPEFFVDKRAGTAEELSPQETAKKYTNEVKRIDDFLFETVDGQKKPKQWLTDVYPPDEGMSADDPKYHDRLVQAVAQRIRFQGDFKAEQLRTGRADADPLYDQMRKSGMFNEMSEEEKLLRATEAMHYLHLQAENDTMLEEYQKTREELMRFSIKPVESPSGGLMDLSGEAPIFNLPNLTPEQIQNYQQQLESYRNFREMAAIANNQAKMDEYDQKIKQVQDNLYGREQRKKVSAESPFVPDMDLYASALLTDAFMDLPYEKDSDGQPVTMRQKIEQIQGKIMALKAQPSYHLDDLNRLTNEAMLLRKEFYGKAREVLQKRNIASPFNERNSPFQYYALQLLRDFNSPTKTPNMLEALVDRYVAHHHLPNDNGEALKQSLMARLTKLYNIQQGESGVTNFATYAHEGVDFLERKTEIALAEPELHKIPKTIRGKDFIKVGRYEEVPLDYEVPILKGKGSEPPTPVPPTPEPLPLTPPNPEPITPPKPGDEKGVEPAPVKKDEDVTPPGPPRPPTPEKEPLQLSHNLAIVGDMEQQKKEIEGGVDFQLQLAQKIDYKSKNKIGRFFETIGHIPKIIGRGVWQNTFFQPVFREREKRWRRSLMEETGLSHLPNELVEEAMKQGKEKTKHRNFFRKVLLDSWYNFGVQIYGLDTTQRIEAKQWLKKQVDLVRQGSAQVDAKFKGVINSGYDEKEAFGARLAIDNDIVLHKGDQREVLADRQKQEQLEKDFFTLLIPYINGQKDDAWAKQEIDKYCSEKDVTQFGLAKVLGDQYKGLVDQTTVVGSNMRRIAEYFKNNRQRFVEEGIINKSDDINSWLEACRSTDPNKKINFKIFIAQAEISEAGDVSKKKREKATTLLAAREKSWLENAAGNSFVRWAVRFAPSLGLNEVTIAGYVGSLAYSLIPSNPTQAKMIGGALGIPLIVAGSAAMPVLIPIGAGAAAAGVFSGVREAIRLGKERRSIERDASFNILPGDEIKLNGFSRFMGAIYGRTSRQKMIGEGTQEKPGYIAHQRLASELASGLTRGSGLFSDPEKLTSTLPENVSIDQVRKALHFLAESKARIDLTAETNRRFIRYDGQLVEAQQQEILDGATKEVFERLSFLFTQRQDLKTEFFKFGVTDFRCLYDRLVSAYQYNLTGDNKAMTPDLRQLVDLLGTDAAKGFIAEKQSLKKRDRAFKWLQVGKGIHRAGGVATTSLVTGMAVAEAKHLLTGSPPPWPWREHLPTGAAKIDNGPALSNTELDRLNVSLPAGYHTVDSNTFVDDHGITHHWSDMEIVDANHNGVMESGEALLLRDKNTHEVLFNLAHDAGKDITGGQTDIFKPDVTTHAQGLDLDHNGSIDVQVKVPDNTHWVQNSDDSWNLQGTDVHSNSITLISNAKIEPNGHISGIDYQGNHVEYNPSSGIMTGPDGGVMGGKDLWQSAANYRVVHAGSETAIPINNYTYSTGDTAHPSWGVKFAFPDSAVHNPNTGVTEYLHTAAENGRLGLLLQVPHYGPQGKDVSIFVPAHFDNTLHQYVVDFNPTDQTTMIALPDGSHISMANLSQIFLNEEKLAQHGIEGSLGSETWYEGRQFFNLANPDGLIGHQGRILGGYFDTGSKATDYGFVAAPGQAQGAFIATHAIHGSSQIDLGPGEIPPTQITEVNINSISELLPGKIGYQLAPELLPTQPGDFSVGVLPTPFTSYAEVGGVKETSTFKQATAPAQPPPPPPRPVPPTPAEDEKKKKDELERQAYLQSRERGRAELDRDLQLVKTKGALSEDEFKTRWLKTPAEAEADKDNTVKNVYIEILLEEAVFNEVFMSLPAEDRAFLKKIEEESKKEGFKLSPEDEQRLTQLQKQIHEKAQELLAGSDDKRNEFRAKFDAWEAEAAKPTSSTPAPTDNRSNINEGNIRIQLAQRQAELNNLEALIRFKKGKQNKDKKLREEVPDDEKKAEQLKQEIAALETSLNVSLPTEMETKMVISDEEWKKLPVLKPGDLKFNKEQIGSVVKSGASNAFIVEIGLQQKKAPYEVYDYDMEKKKFRLRKLYPGAPTLTLIAPNGSVFDVKADAGYVLDFDENYFIIDNVFYSLFENSVLIAVTDQQKIKELKKKIEKRN